MRAISLTLLVVMFLLGTSSCGWFGGSSPTEEPKEPEPDLFLEILTPENESVVFTKELTVTGKTLSTAIVSVNGNLVSVDEDGGFSLEITLVEGPNLIEALASDIGGNEVGKISTIIYIPE